MISGVFWLHRLVKFIYNVCCYWEIRSFYINALKMSMVSMGWWLNLKVRGLVVLNERDECYQIRE